MGPQDRAERSESAETASDPRRDQPSEPSGRVGGRRRDRPSKSPATSAKERGNAGGGVGSSTPSPSASSGALRVDGHATLFGFDDEPVRAEIIARSRAWRVGGAARTFAIFAVIAPFVAIVPPHAVWLIGALATGAILARRRYIERYTLVDVEGRCPKCHTPLSAKSGRLERPHPLPCEGCNHEPSLRIPDDALERLASE